MTNDQINIAIDRLRKDYEANREQLGWFMKFADHKDKEASDYIGALEQHQRSIDALIAAYEKKRPTNG